MVAAFIRAINNRFPLGDMHARLLDGASWSAIAVIVSRGALFIAMFLTARILGAKSYGEYAIVQSSISLFEIFASAGMGVTATKHISQYKKNNKKKVGEIIVITMAVVGILGLPIALLLIYSSGTIARDVLSNPDLSLPLCLGAIVLLLNLLNGTVIGIIIGFEGYEEMARANIISGIVTVVAIPVGAFYADVLGALLGVMLSTAVLVVINGFIVIKKIKAEQIRLYYKMHRDNWRMLWEFSLPAMLAGAVMVPVVWLANTMLINQPNGYKEMGVYAATNQWLSILLFIPATITMSLLPVFSDYSGEKNFIDLKRAIRLGVKTSLLVVAPIAATIACLSPLIMPLYGSEYASRWDLLVVVCIAAVVASTNNVIGNLFMSINRARTHLISNIIWSATFLSSAFLLIRAGFGALALAEATLAAYAIKTAFIVNTLRNYFRKVGC